MALELLGRYQEAVECYEEVFENSPAHSVALLNRGIILAKLGKYQEAIDCYDNLIAIDRLQVEALTATDSLFNMGLTLTRMDRNAEALEYYNKALIEENNL